MQTAGVMLSSSSAPVAASYGALSGDVGKRRANFAARGRGGTRIPEGGGGGGYARNAGRNAHAFSSTRYVQPRVPDAILSSGAARRRAPQRAITQREPRSVPGERACVPPRNRARVRIWAESVAPGPPEIRSAEIATGYLSVSLR